MKHTTQYSVGGDIYDVSDERYDEFVGDAMKDYEEDPEEVYTFFVDGKEVKVKASRLDEFMADCEADGVTPRKTQAFEMDDGNVLRLGDEDVRQFVQARRQGMPMSRGMLKNTGIPEQYGRSAAEREALADMFARYYPDEKVNGLGSYRIDEATSQEDMGVPENMNIVGFDPTNMKGFIPPESVLKDDPRGMLDYMKTSKEAQYGRDLNAIEATAANLPFVGSAMDANEARKESVEKRLYSGDFRDSLEASKLALSIGIPQEEVRRVNEEANGDRDAMRMGYSDLVRNQLAQRIVTRRNKGERLDDFDLNILQNVGAGAAGLVKTVSEMSSPVSAAATIGPSMMNRSAGMANGSWTVGPDGKPVEVMSGDDSDTAMLKGLGGAVAERAIWMNPWMSKWAGAVANKAGGSMIANNAAQVVDMTLKNDLTELVDNVVGLDKSQIDESKTVAKWAEEHFLPQNLAKDIIHSAVVHVGMKGMRLATKSGREALLNEIGSEIKRRGALEERRIAQERAAEVAKENERVEAKARYEANLSEESIADIERNVNEMVKAEVIPSYRHAEEVAKRAAEKLTREQGESAEAVQQAVMEAAQEVNERLQTPSRVESPSLERRQTEAEMRNNERLSKYGERFAEENLETPVERAPDDTAAIEAERSNRQAELDAAFAEYNASIADAKAKQKSGKRASAETPAAIRDSMKDDAVLQMIDAEYKKAKTDEERNALKEKFKERVDELRAAKEETQNQTQETSKTDGEASKTDSDAAFRAWAVGRDGKPMEFATPADEKASRDTFDMLVKMGKVDPKTGKTIETAGEEAGEATDSKYTPKTTPPKDLYPDYRYEVQAAAEKAFGNDKANINADFYDINPYAGGPLWSFAQNIGGTAYHTYGKIPSSQSLGEAVADGWNKYGKKAWDHQSEIIENAFKKDGATVNTEIPSVDKPYGKGRNVKKTSVDVSASEESKTTGESSLDEKAEYPVGTKLTRDDGTEYVRIDGTITDVDGSVSPAWREVSGAKRKTAQENVFYSTNGGKTTQSIQTRKPDGKGRMVDVGTTARSQETNADDIAEPKTTEAKNSTAIDSARALLKDKFYQDAGSLTKQMNALPSQATELRAAYETAIAEAKRRAGEEKADEAVKPDGKIMMVKDGTDAKGSIAKSSASMVQKRLSPTNLKEGTLAKAEKPLAEDVKDAGIGSKTQQEGGEIDKLNSLVDERTDMRRNDPKLRSDPKVLEWAKKKGRTISDGMVTPDARRAYDEEMTAKTAKQAKRWFPDMKIVQHKYGENIERGKEVIDLRDTSGNSLGWFDPNTKETHLLPGANAETVAHEIMWHGTRDWAETQAAKGNAAAQKLLAKMKDVEQHVPDALKNKVTRLYRASGVTSADVLFNEWGAWFTMGKGGKALEEAVATKEGRKWYAKALSTIKEIYKDFMSNHGRNRVDLSQIDGMTRDEFVDFLSKEFAGGKTLGEIGGNKGNGKELSTEETAWQKARRRAYDSVAPVRDLEREIEKKTGKKISSEDSVDAALALRPGEHEAVVINQKKQLGEIKDMLKKYGISSEDLGYYMALKAATGRDAKIDAKNLEKIEAEVREEVSKEWGSNRISKDNTAFENEVAKRFAERKAEYVSTNGSHVDPREVSKMIPEIEGGAKAVEYGAARDKINEIQENTMDTLVDAGLISKADAEKLRKEEPDYVPFKSEFDAETGEYVGRANNNLAKRTFYEAKGRKSAAGDILAHILNDNAMAHNKAIENIAREKMAKIVEAHPELGTVTPLGNRTLKEARRGKGGDGNVILFKREGKTYAIELNGERGKAIAAAFTGVNQAKPWGWVQKASRAWASTATELSPTFAVRNVTKDNIELSENVIKEMGYVKGTKFVGKYLKNQVKSFSALAKFVTTGKIDTSTESGRILQQFIDDGGMIGGYGTEGYSDISRSLSSEQIIKEMKKGSSAVKAAAKHTLHAVGYINKMSEMTSRLNAYRTQLEMGMSRTEAALWSRRTLTDFNRKGDMTGVTNVLRMFSNSTLGATAKAATGLATTKGGLALSAGLIANGVSQALIEHYSNLEDDENNKNTGRGTGKDVSEYDRKTSFWLARDAKDGKITKIGSHEGPFQLINYVGNCAARVALGDMTAKDMAKELGMSLAELGVAFTGLGSVNFDSNEEGVSGAIKAFVSSAMPSVAQPFFEIGTNTDYAGRKVYTEKAQSDNTPYYKRARKNTPEWAKDSAEFANTATGGNEFRAGKLDVPAEVVQKIVESFGKNAAKDVITAYETGKSIINGTFDDLEDRMVPFKRDFVRDVPDNTSRYFDAKRTFGVDDDEFKGLSKKMTKDERIAYIKDHPWVVRSKQINEIIGKIEDLRKYEDNKVKSGRGFVESKEKFSKEQIENFKKSRLMLQKKVLELIGM